MAQWLKAWEEPGREYNHALPPRPAHVQWREGKTTKALGVLDLLPVRLKLLEALAGERMAEALL